MTAAASWIEAVSEVAQVAGRVALSHYGRSLHVETKADLSPVTIADRAAEASARAWIDARFPNDGIVGEEWGVTRPAASRRWFIDPIDGTKSFIRQVPLWGTLVAVYEGDRAVAGAACFPAIDEIVAAATGAGCWWNGARCHVSNVAALRDSLVLTTDEQFAAAPERRSSWQRLASNAAHVRTWGDCYGYLLVATGRAEAMVDPILADWDAAPLLPIIVEAGGAFTDWRGQATAFGGSAIATNAAVAYEARTLLGLG
jgi:histidinol-phosphatase